MYCFKKLLNSVDTFFNAAQTVCYLSFQFETKKQTERLINNRKMSFLNLKL